MINQIKDEMCDIYFASSRVIYETDEYGYDEEYNKTLGDYVHLIEERLKNIKKMLDE